jgi:hypothetical protein
MKRPACAGPPEAAGARFATPPPTESSRERRTNVAVRSRDDDPRSYRRALGAEFLVHYTDPIRADAIIEERCFVSGSKAASGFGIYATDIAPVDEETIDEVMRARGVADWRNRDSRPSAGGRARTMAGVDGWILRVRFSVSASGFSLPDDWTTGTTRRPAVADRIGALLARGCALRRLSV